MVHTFFEEQPEPCAVVILIEEGSTVLFKTLGVANREENRPVDPETTLFRAASISKVVNTMGVLSRVEAGLLHLDRDINSHFETPIIHNRFETPVTLRHLLTHTAGLDDHFIGKTSRSREEAPSLEEAMWNQLPKQVIPPCEVASYSNFGAALSGYLTEFVSGMNYTALMGSILFQPLAFAILLLFRVIRDKDAGSVRKYFSMMIFLLSLLFFMSLYYWNLVGWKFKVELWS